MATTSRTGMIILGSVGVAVLSIGGTVLAAGGAHEHDDSAGHLPRDGSMMGMMGGSMMGGSMMGGSMMGDIDPSTDHEPMMDPSQMPSWMWQHMWEHMGITAADGELEPDEAGSPAAGASPVEQEPETAE